MKLSAGDIAIVGFNFDNPDEFAFTSLVDIGAGTQINFTDNGWRADGSFRPTEGTFTWTAATDIAAGTIINPTLSNILFSAAGDQIIADQGDSSSPNFLYALNSEGNPGIWQSDSTSSNTSALPTGLVNGETAVAINEFDNAIYTGITSGTQAELLAAISNSSKWKNRAGRTWTLQTTKNREILKVGKDCPYFDDGHTTATVIWDGNQVLGILGPWNERYDRSN